jgi:uracil DNA glycosylase
MLNTCLTVRASQPGSHSNKGWEEFTDKVVDVVDKYGGANLGDANGNGIGRGVVFLAWGAWAAKRVAKLNTVSLCFTSFSIDANYVRYDQTKHLILKSAVSPLIIDGIFHHSETCLAPASFSIFCE